MKRILTFEDSEEGRDRFSMLYQGFNAGGIFRYQREPKPMAVARLESKIFDAFDLVSDAAPAGTPNALLMRSLMNGSGDQVVALEEPEYELLRTYFDCAAGAWQPLAARKVVEVADWLSGVPRSEWKAPRTWSADEARLKAVQG